MPKVSPAPARTQQPIAAPTPPKAKGVNPFAALLSGLNLGVKGADAFPLASAASEPGDRQAIDNDQAQDPQDEAQEQADSAGSASKSCALDGANTGEAGIAAAIAQSGHAKVRKGKPGDSADELASGGPALVQAESEQVSNAAAPSAGAQAEVQANADGSGATGGAQPGTNVADRARAQATGDSSPANAQNPQGTEAQFETELKSPAQPHPNEAKDVRATAADTRPNTASAPGVPPNAAAQDTSAAVASQAAASAGAPGQQVRAGQAVRPAGTQGIGPLGALPPSAAKQAALNRLTAQAPALKQSVVQHAFIPQAAKGLAMALKQGEGTITLNLKPAHLGTLRVEVSMQASEATVKLEASSETARQLLSDAQPSLRAALEARGLSVERIDITAAPSAPPQDAADHRPEHNAGQHAGDGQGQHTGHGAEAHTGGGQRHGSQGDVEVAESWTSSAPLEISFALDKGGLYRLHLDAVA